MTAMVLLFSETSVLCGKMFFSQHHRSGCLTTVFHFAGAAFLMSLR